MSDTSEARLVEAADDLIGALDTLLACYRVGRRPTGRQLDRITAARKSWRELTSPGGGRA